jgi:hypothetical protein
MPWSSPRLSSYEPLTSALGGKLTSLLPLKRAVPNGHMCAALQLLWWVRPQLFAP